jgi:hypothetical protein
MKYNEEFLKYQRVLNRAFKKKYKSFISVEIDPSDFEKVMESKDSVQLLNMNFNWSVSTALKENENLKDLSSYAKNIFITMFGESFVVPWMSLITKYNED